MPWSEIWYCVTGPHTHKIVVSSFLIMCWNMKRRPREVATCSGFMPSMPALKKRPISVSVVLPAPTSIVSQSYMLRSPLAETACSG